MDIKILNKEMERVTNLLGFLIEQPQISTSLTGIEKDKLMAFNLLRIRCANLWSKQMEKQIQDKIKIKTLNSMNELFKHIEIA